MANDGILLGLALFLGIGFITGLRSMTGPAVVAWAVYLGWLHPGRRTCFRRTHLGGGVVHVAGDRRADCGQTPHHAESDRRHRVGRSHSGSGILWGGVGGGDSPEPLVGNGDHRDHGCDRRVCGYRVRRYLTKVRGLPDFPVAVAEDLFTILVGIFTVRRGL